MAPTLKIKPWKGRKEKEKKPKEQTKKYDGGVGSAPGRRRIGGAKE